ncbi:MAG: GGDEF domain-containing protein [Anaerolineales bacterium]|nr:GGDEF domain-containing protein [Anaerolineales bacterium]
MAEPRRTVGVLVGFQVFEGFLPNPFVSPIVRGIQTAARDQGINLLVGCGIGRDLSGERRYFPAWPEEVRTADFVPVGPWNTDGLLVLNPLRFPEQLRYLRDLAVKEFPVLCVGAGAGTPMILVDNEGGIRQAMEHLVEHGHRAVAFIAGDEADPGDSQDRLHAYRRAVQELGLRSDPHLVEFGQHWAEGGYRAMRRLLQSGVEFSAAVCSNDESAQGAMRALRESGLRVPRDVALTGFDDHLTAQAQVPPLTSVHYPLFETGYRALLLLRKRIERGPGAIPDQTRVSTWLVPRQSCGCLPDVVSTAVIRRGMPFNSDRLNPARFKEDLAQAMMESLLAETTPSRIPDSRPLCDRLVESFLLSLEDGDLSHFQIALIEVLQRIELMDDDAHAWQAAVSVLRLGAHTLLSDDCGARRETHAEDLLHQARMLISESARRRHQRMRLRQTHFEEAMGCLTAKLLSSFEEDQIQPVLQEYLPQLGIRSGRIALYESRDDDPFRDSRLLMESADAPPLRFPTRAFPPPGLIPKSNPFNLAVLPLMFRSENLGYAVFDGENLAPLAMVACQAASAVKSAALHRQVTELTLLDGMTGLYNRRYFDILLRKEFERSRRYDRPLSLVLAEIDGFSEYREVFGPSAAADALRQAAEGILGKVRRGLDVIARIGGERFAVILPETDADGARIVAEGIRGAFAAENRFLRKLTVSLGISACSGESAQPVDLVSRAEGALSQAVVRGRNQAALFEEWMQNDARAKAGRG